MLAFLPFALAWVQDDSSGENTSKAKRDPPKTGKEVIAFGESLDALLYEIAVLTTREHRNRGVIPTR